MSRSPLGKWLLIGAFILGVYVAGESAFRIAGTKYFAPDVGWIEGDGPFSKLALDCSQYPNLCLALNSADEAPSKADDPVTTGASGSLIVKAPGCLVILRDDGSASCPSGSSCAACDHLSRSKVAFNRPDRMNFKNETPMELVLAPNTSGVDPARKLDAELPGDVKTLLNIPTAKLMQAELYGSDFEVYPKGPIQRTVLPTQITRWSWNVRPIQYGEDRLLTMELVALQKEGPDILPPTDPVVVRVKIPVDIEPWDRVVEAATSISLVHGAVAAVGTTFVVVMAWLWARVRGGKKEQDVLDLLKRPQPPNDNT
ncbi:hypothetical protein ACLMJV_31135 [Sinorhizobium meliloti]|uniref:hypothetical protein n=1 Tax=Rhizobium meliloti TaxID=382 RepID=UPI000FD9630C|nr:hypothetical protein [Sinorhizobium meliloti]RVH53708.1 hypothetical protein CN212_01015 [Sinorhizobium meliloti]